MCASAAQILTFYAHLATFQKSLFESFQSPGPKFSSEERWEDLLDTELLLPRYPDFLKFLASTAPASIVAAAREMMTLSRDCWAASLRTLWERRGGSSGITGSGSDSMLPDDRAAESMEERFLALAYLQPYAEHLRCLVQLSPRPDSPVCPACGAEPVCGILRPEGQGARRSLLCSFCASEWDFPRAICPACNEQRAEALPVFIAQDFEHVRLEACDSCKQYIKTVDLTKNGRAVPVVDELAAVSLSLWARENGYGKLQPNLFAL